jgi:hypothetical protein
MLVMGLVSHGMVQLVGAGFLDQWRERLNGWAQAFASGQVMGSEGFPHLGLISESAGLDCWMLSVLPIWQDEIRKFGTGKKRDILSPSVSRLGFVYPHPHAQ